MFYFGVLLITFGELSLSDRLSIMTKLKKIIWDDDGNVVLASAYRQCCCLGAGMSSPDEPS
jgi:hypothetical protein